MIDRFRLRHGSTPAVSSVESPMNDQTELSRRIALVIATTSCAQSLLVTRSDTTHRSRKAPTFGDATGIDYGLM